MLSAELSCFWPGRCRPLIWKTRPGPATSYTGALCTSTKINLTNGTVLYTLGIVHGCKHSHLVLALAAKSESEKSKRKQQARSEKREASAEMLLRLDDHDSTYPSQRDSGRTTVACFSARALSHTVPVPYSIVYHVLLLAAKCRRSCHKSRRPHLRYSTSYLPSTLQSLSSFVAHLQCRTLHTISLAPARNASLAVYTGVPRTSVYTICGA